MISITCIIAIALFMRLLACIDPNKLGWRTAYIFFAGAFMALGFFALTLVNALFS